MGVPFWVSDTSRGFDGPVYAKNPHETIFIGGLQLPGICKVTALPSQQVDRQKVSGGDGATIIVRGYLPGPVDVECEMWLPSQWEVFQNVQAQIWTKPGKLAGVEKAKGKAAVQAAAIAEREALDIAHPALQALSISRVVVVGISLPTPGQIPQSRVVHIKCLEFVPTPKTKATAKIKGSAKVERDAKLTTAKFPSANAPGLSPSAAGAGGPNGPKPKGATGGA